MNSLLLAMPALAAALALPAAQGARDLVQRQSCPNVHVFGARETTASPGYGSAGTVVNAVLGAYSGSTAEAIDYPACGGDASCGGVSYGNSANQGTAAVAKAVNDFATSCPDAQIILVGYSQGGQIIDNAFCGGGDSTEGISSTAVPISSGALAQIKAVIMMGNPRFEAGFSYEVGTCKAGGFDARPSSFSCPSASKIQSYCDAADPYCCNGNDAATHNGYGSEYGSDALAFIKSQLSSSTSAAGSGTAASASASAPATAPSTAQASAPAESSSPANVSSVAVPVSSSFASSSGGSGTIAKYAQCGGSSYSGSGACTSGTTCKSISTYYSQCA